MTCSVLDCPNDPHSLGMCMKHYTRRRRGQPMERPCIIDGCTDDAVRTRPALCHKHAAEEASVDGACRIDLCPKSAKRRGMCTAHYYRMYEQGRLDLLPTLSPEERFWAMVTKTDECWLWTGATDRRGYGKFEIKRRSYDGTTPSERTMAHRYAYVLIVGPIPDGHDLDHTCEVKNCVRPDHLDPVTRAEHARRTSMRKTHCKRGHELAGDNIVIKNGARHCLACRKIQNRKWSEKRKALRAARAN